MLSVYDAPQLLTCSSPLYARATPRAELSDTPTGARAAVCLRQTAAVGGEAAHARVSA